jgi:steroid delta-isomerase-like uncharacterized protein
MTRDEMVAFFDRRLDKWRRRDAAALAADHAEDSLVQSPTSALQRGRKAIQSVHELWFKAFPDMEFHQEDLIVDGDRAAAIIRFAGTHMGEFFGMPPTGRRVEFRAVFIYTMGDGQIVHERRVLDFTGVLLQVGVLKARPS